MPNPVDEIAKQMELYERIENQPHPYRQDVRLVISDLNSMGEGIDRVLSKWRDEFLIPAKEHVPNVTSQDFDAYSKPILTLAEMIRRTGFSELRAPALIACGPDYGQPLQGDA